MGDSLVVPDLWDTIRVYDAHIQSLKAFKSDCENLLSQKKDLEEAQKQLSDDQQALKNDQSRLCEDQKVLKDSQDQLCQDKMALETSLGQLKADQETLDDDRKKVDADREALKKSEKELHEENKLLRVANSDLTGENKGLKGQVEERNTKVTDLEQENQNLTDANTKLKQQVTEGDGGLKDLRCVQKQLAEAKKELRVQKDAFHKVIHTFVQDKHDLQAENRNLTGQVADLQKKLEDQAPTATMPKLKTYHTGRDGKDTWAAVAETLQTSTKELFDLNRDIDCNQFKWDKCVVCIDRS